MPSINLNFSNPIQVSVQIGDTVYYTDDINGETIVEIGLVTDIDFDTNTITATIADTTTRPTTSSFILFSKTNSANISGLTGYYMRVDLKNDSTEDCEIFSVGTEVFESSK